MTKKFLLNYYPKTTHLLNSPIQSMRKKGLATGPKQCQRQEEETRFSSTFLFVSNHFFNLFQIFP
ncbi:MAG: hypothetical protein K6A31_01195, partial [Fibrobacter sp.]|nr:hypothetical protein [Fibrobacter sp.]